MWRNILDNCIRIKKYTETINWLLFFFCLYVIALIKFITFFTFLNENIFFLVYSTIVTIYIFSRFLLAYFYKTIPCDLSYEPTITFVVPAKNEEDNVAETIRKFSLVNYPKDKIEVIAVNDGSTDNTYSEMLKAKKIVEGGGVEVEVINWKVNRGKRAGMAEGVRRAKNDIIIFIDSDSFIDTDCVRHLVKYFSNENIGAVSGHTDVYNKNVNLLTRMQALRYYIAFRVYKASESIFGNVTCCPGCCSAYRRKYIIDLLDKWENQKFLGGYCTFGDDRSLTNFVIRKYKAVYCIDARARTVVPENFIKYIKQQQRWKKSWVRETIIASSFMWRKNIITALTFYSYMFLAFSSPVVFFRSMFWRPFASGIFPYYYILGLIMVLVFHGIYYRIYSGEKKWFLPVIVFWSYVVILIWQLPWAVITIKDSRWGTR